LGVGQFCTNPGLTIVQQNEQSKRFIEQVKLLFAQNSSSTLLGASVPEGIAQAISTLQTHGAEILTGGQEIEGAGFVFANTLLLVSGDRFVQNPEMLQTEAFGTVNLIVTAHDTSQMVEIAARLEGNLTGCIYSHSEGADDAIYEQLEPILRQKVGRLLNDKMPTGVAVVPSMNHGGPYPSTGHPGFTAVGIPASMLRFTALHCYDNVRHHRLPLELQDKNPTGQIWRLLDGEWTQRDI
jgi:NADP-dependent aldehyde dehydrogenase